MSEFHNVSELIGVLYSRHNVPELGETLVEYNVRRYNETPGDLDKIDGYNCDKCKNRGYIAKVNEQGYEVHVKCRCLETRATLRRARESGLGNVLSDFTFAKFETPEPWQKQIKDRARAFCEDDEAKWFFIGGQSGCGKSHLCTAISAHYIKAGKKVKYMLWVDESKELKASVNDISYSNTLRDIKASDVLYIDDFLKNPDGIKPTAADLKLAFEIINNRLYDAEKITIISTEYMLDALIDFDEATMGRVFQKAGAYRLNIPKDRAKNYRLRE